MSKKLNSGFTFIELMIVLALIGIMVPVSLSVGNAVRQNARMSSTMNAFVADFYNCKQMAVAENRLIAIVFSDDGGSYTVRRQRRLVSLDEWDDLRTVRPLGGDPFFNPLKTEVQDICINARGEILAYPPTANAKPITTAMQFVVLKHPPYSTENIVKSRSFTLFPSGGITYEKR